MLVLTLTLTLTLALALTLTFRKVGSSKQLGTLHHEVVDVRGFSRTSSFSSPRKREAFRVGSK